MLWVKFVHISGLLVWCAGLLALPLLLLAHGREGDPQDFARVRRAGRFAYMGITSPAAFVAVGAGTILVLIADALHPWMFLKLLVVGVLVLAHIQFGHLVAELRLAERKPPRLRIAVLTGLVALAIPSILWLVLAKPEIDWGNLPPWLTEPGLLDAPSSRS